MMRHMPKSLNGMKAVFPWVASLLATTVSAQEYTVQLLNTGSTVGIDAIHFPDAFTGYAVGQGSGVLKTGDGGSTWSMLDLPAAPLRDVHFLDPLTGYVVGDYGIFKTVDGGATWANVRPGQFRSVHFTSYDTGYAAGTSPNTGVWRSIDAGATWSQVFGASASDFLYSPVMARAT
jgi:photosystem II stability/assembly factor-like uncharacterized protein